MTTTKLKPIFSGKHSRELWDDINEANTVDKLRWAVYHLACHCQEYEDSRERNRRYPVKGKGK